MSPKAFRALAFLVVVNFVPQLFGAAVVRSGAGLTATTAARDQFRVDLGGGTTAGAAGLFGGVRREINWDGVPDALSAPNNLPANFFNVNSPRGVVFSTPGTGFQVSSTTASGTAVRFGNINATYTTTFTAFSPERLFTALGSNTTDVNFFVSGTTTPATVSGFGSVFSDVDLGSVTTIQFFDTAGASLGVFSVPPATGDVSFLGVSFNAGERVARVRITSGNVALGPNDSVTSDVVTMDDFLFSEPAAIPAAAIPALSTWMTLALFAVIGMIGFLKIRA